MAFQPGARLGAYELLSLIGSGGMGEVYRARDVDLDRLVAIKVLPQRSASNVAGLIRFEREARLASSLNHPHIITIYNIGREESTPYIVMELQQWCFEQDFQRLGPSIYRVLESRLLGYQKLKDSPNPRLRQKAEVYARDLRVALPVFLAGRLLGPNAAVRQWIGNLEQRLHEALGRPALTQRYQSVLGVGAALWTRLTLKLDLFQHPRLIRTTYRMASKS
ncbi:MAG: protein kinase [Sulfuricaulis sp.]|nr:protein kinase [Sulfuricaulis sp.]